jgi:serine protease Do
MMKKYFLKAAGLAMLALTLNASSFAQDESPKEKSDKHEEHEEIIISKKGDKDVKMTVEIKDGKILINGKQVDEFDDDNISIHKRIKRIINDDNLSFIAPESPFRGENFSYSGDGDILVNAMDSKTAFLGVSSEKAEVGGAKITEISKASPAEKSGLQKGDVITKIDEIQISTPEDLSKAIHKYKPEDKVTVTYKRDNKEEKLTAVLGKFKGLYTKTFNISIPKMEELQNMKGYSDMNRMYAPRAFSWSSGKPKIGIKAQDTEDGKGVKVLDVDDESPADKAGIKEGDIITEFDGKVVNSADVLAEASRAAKDKASFKVKLKRDDKQQEVEIKIPKKLKTADL